MEITIHGEGGITVRFINKKGQTLIEERLTVTGSPSVEARRVVPLTLETTAGPTLVAPVLVSRTHEDLRVRFDGKNPGEWTRERCRKIGCVRSVAEDAARGSAPGLMRGQIGASLSDGPDIVRLLERGKP